MRGDVIAILNHIYGRQISFKSGVITSRSMLNGVPLGEHLATMTSDDFNVDKPTKNFDDFIKGVLTACRTQGHTSEAAKYTRRSCFSLLDHFGMISLFFTFSPCGECSFRVRVYATPQKWVSLEFVT